jgi:hypothetical protein
MVTSSRTTISNTLKRKINTLNRNIERQGEKRVMKRNLSIRDMRTTNSLSLNPHVLIAYYIQGL